MQFLRYYMTFLALFAVICVEILGKRCIIYSQGKIWISYENSRASEQHTHTHILYKTKCDFPLIGLDFSTLFSPVQIYMRYLLCIDLDDSSFDTRFSEGSRNEIPIVPARICIRDLSQLFIGHYKGIIELQEPIGCVLRARKYIIINK